MTNRAPNTNQEVIHCPRCGHINLRCWKFCYGCKADLPRKSIELRDWAAIAAVLISFFTFIFSYSLSVNIMNTNIQPLLGTTFEWSDQDRSEELNNFGIGPAIITYFKFYNETNQSSNINDLIRLPYNADCSYFTDFSIPYYIRRDQKIIIANISSDELKERGYDETQIFEILNAWDEEIHKINMNVEYQNSLGKVIGKLDGPMRTDQDLDLIKH